VVVHHRGLGVDDAVAKQSGLISTSMYQRFLGLALDEAPDDDGLTRSEALVQVMLCRSQLRQRSDSPDESRGTASALGEELGYDIALLRLARLLGIEVDVQAFSQPSLERSRLEQAIETQGIRLDELDT
jgi:hypothetical protein